MSVAINVSFDTAPIVRGFEDLARKQIPFATAVALTRTAKDAAEDVRNHLGDDFTLRSSWVARGITISPATKTRLRAEVRSRDKFMALQETGGDRVPSTPGRDAVPVTGSAARPSKAAKSPRRVWPANLKRGYAVKRGSASTLIFARYGRGKKSTSRLLWVVSRAINVAPRWHLQAIVERDAARRLPEHFKRELLKAIRTARR